MPAAALGRFQLVQAAVCSSAYRLFLIKQGNDQAADDVTGNGVFNFDKPSRIGAPISACLTQTISVL